MCVEMNQPLPPATLLGRGLTWEEMALVTRIRTFARTITEADTDASYGEQHGAIRARLAIGIGIRRSPASRGRSALLGAVKTRWSGLIG